MKLFSAFLLITFAAPAASAQQQRDASERLVAALDSNRIRTHLAVLAHDSLEGRGPGTRG